MSFRDAFASVLLKLFIFYLQCTALSPEHFMLNDFEEWYDLFILLYSLKSLLDGLDTYFVYPFVN